MEQQRSLSDIPESLLCLILARLDVYSLPRCAQVCKSWSLIITRSPTFARLHASLHSSHTCLFASHLRYAIVFYDTLAKRISFGKLSPLNECSFDIAHATSAQIAHLERLQLIHLIGEILATSEGLVLLMSMQGDFIVTNIVTRRTKLLPSPNPPLCHIAFAGMLYFWETMSYQVLLCGQQRQTSNLQGGLFTCVYNSLTHCWTNASAELPVPAIHDHSPHRHPKTSVWFEGNFYCVMGRALRLFNLETMEWDSISSLPLHNGLDHTGMQLCLPSELVHFYCLWVHKGQLRLAGSVNTEKSKFVTHVWCLFKSYQTRCGMFRWQDFACLPLIASEGPTREFKLEGRRWHAHGDYLCVTVVEKIWTLEVAVVQFYVYDLAEGDLKIVKCVPCDDDYYKISSSANVAIQPCPFTYP